MKAKAIVIEGLFFASWLFVGCSLDCSVESKGNMAVTAIAAVVAIACAWIMSRKK